MSSNQGNRGRLLADIVYNTLSKLNILRILENLIIIDVLANNLWRCFWLDQMKVTGLLVPATNSFDAKSEEKLIITWHSLNSCKYTQ